VIPTGDLPDGFRGQPLELRKVEVVDGLHTVHEMVRDASSKLVGGFGGRGIESAVDL
jgi:hypothetical protein